MEPALYAVYPPDTAPPAIATMLNEVVPLFREGDLERGMNAFVKLLELRSETIQALSKLPFVGNSGKNIAAFANEQQVVVQWRPTDEELSTLHAPTLLLEGELTTRLLRDIVSLLHPKLPNATVRTLSGCDHMAPQIRPDVVVSAIRAFAKEHAPSSIESGS